MVSVTKVDRQGRFYLPKSARRKWNLPAHTNIIADGKVILLIQEGSMDTVADLKERLTEVRRCYDSLLSLERDMMEAEQDG